MTSSCPDLVLLLTLDTSKEWHDDVIGHYSWNDAIHILLLCMCDGR